NRKSPTSSDRSIEGVGITYASMKNVRISVAAITAKTMASIHSRATLFFFLAFFGLFFFRFQNFQFIIFLGVEEIYFKSKSNISCTEWKPFLSFIHSAAITAPN